MTSAPTLLAGESSFEYDAAALHSLIENGRAVFAANPSIRCPYFDSAVTLNADGFNHLLHKPNRQPRTVAEQMLKLRLVKKAARIIRKAGTLQEYRQRYEKVGKPARDGFTKTKPVEYWAFHDIVGEKKRFLMRVILRRVGDGKSPSGASCRTDILTRRNFSARASRMTDTQNSRLKAAILACLPSA